MKLTIAGIAPRRICCKFAEKKIMKTAFFISPHLDDAVFSCGGTLAKLAAEGWRTILCTIFTKSVVNPQGFALRCQMDKNLAADVDYMKLRRAEDFRAAKILGAAETLHLNFLEAPHRGYESAAELFAGEKPGDEVWKAVAEYFEMLNEIHQPEIVFAPQGLGSHADHLQTIRAARSSFSIEKIRWYRDLPYAIRQPDALPSELLPPGLFSLFSEIKIYLPQKIAACAAYQSQINFQFGSLDQIKPQLENFHRFEAGKSEETFFAAEILSSPLLDLFEN